LAEAIRVVESPPSAGSRLLLNVDAMQQRAVCYLG
jgi:hypothetical protein